MCLVFGLFRQLLLRIGSESWRTFWPVTERSTADKWMPRSARWPRCVTACSNSSMSTRSCLMSSWLWTWKSTPTASFWKARRTGQYVGFGAGNSWREFIPQNLKIPLLSKWIAILKGSCVGGLDGFNDLISVRIVGETILNYIPVDPVNLVCLRFWILCYTQRHIPIHTVNLFWLAVWKGETFWSTCVTIATGV